jgi:hypothetical protein
MNERESELTHDEHIALAIQIMGQRYEEDLRTGREWQRRQQRVIIIRDEERNDH